MCLRATDPALSGSRVFFIAAAALALAMVSFAGFVASREWFSGDDFAFLAHVQNAEQWSWRAAWLPVGERFWPFYRPLAMESYFRLGFDLFGLAAAGFFAITLSVHFARGAVVYRLARQLGCARPVAVVGGLLGVSGAASFPGIYAASLFHYVLVSLVATLCVSWFLTAMRSRGWRAYTASCFAVFVALLCNESAVVLPGLLFVVAWVEAPSSDWRRACVGAARRVAPHAALVAFYLVLRLEAIRGVNERALYSLAFDLGALRNLGVQMAIACRGSAGFLLLAGIALAGAAAMRRAGSAGRDLARGAVIGLAWVVLGLLPFVAVSFPHSRFSIGIEAPVALLTALALEAIARAAPAASRRRLALAFLLLPLAAFPWAPLLERARHPEGDLPRRLVALIAARAPVLPKHARVVVLYGVEGLADSEAGERFRFLSYNGLVASAVWPDQRVSVRFHDLNQRMSRAVMRPEGVFVALLPDLGLAPAEPALLDRELPRSFTDADRGPESD